MAARRKSWRISRRFGGGGVLEAEAHGGRALFEPAFHDLVEALDLLGGRDFRGGGAFRGWEKSREIAHDLHPRRDVADADAVVEGELFFFFGSVPLLDVGGADFEFEDGGDPVPDLEGVRLLIPAVLVQVDEARSDDEAAGIDGFATDGRGQGCFGKGDNGAVRDGEVADGVEPGLGIDDAAVVDDEILGRRRGGTGEIKSDESGEDGAL